MYRLIHSSFRACTLALLTALALPALAEQPMLAPSQQIPAAEAQKVRAVIEAQLAAFAADDAPRALSYAVPDIRQRFPAPENFLDMVRRSYPVVYRPKSVGFLEPELADNEVYQAVEMSDANGVLWIAIYRMGRLEDGSWRIMGCRVVPGEGRAI
jgi:hypothetical protein